MNIPQEFEDVFCGVELSEGEIRILNWIVLWDDHTIKNLRSAIQKAQATALSTFQDENERLRAELEQVKAERDAAIKDIWVPKWISCKNGENCSFVSAITGMPDCAGCDNWEWRGRKED